MDHFTVGIDGTTVATYARDDLDAAIETFVTLCETVDGGRGVTILYIAPNNSQGA